MAKAKTIGLLLALAAILVALPARGHDPSDAVERMKRSMQVKVDLADQRARRNANMYEQKTEEFNNLLRNFNRLADRLEQSLESSEKLRTRGEELEDRSDAGLRTMTVALDHPTARVRARIATTIGIWRGEAKSAVPALEELQEDADEDVRKAAKAALAKIKSK